MSIRNVFPHISRILPANFFPLTFRLAAWVLLIGLISLNTSMSVNTPGVAWDKLTQILIAPFSAQAHQTAGTQWEEEGLLAAARHEETIAADLSQKTVLGAFSNKVQQDNLILFWNQIIARRPDYRDGYLQLAWALTREQQWAPARAMANRAYVLDPTSLASKQLLDSLNALLEDK